MAANSVKLFQWHFFKPHFHFNQKQFLILCWSASRNLCLVCKFKSILEHPRNYFCPATKWFRNWQKWLNILVPKLQLIIYGCWEQGREGCPSSRVYIDISSTSSHSSSGYFLWFHNFLFWNAIHDILTQSQCYLKYIYGKWDQDELCSSKIQEQRYGWRHTCQSKFILAMAKNCFARPSEKLKLQIDRYFSFNFFG